jgi:YVTN family beta-propeller protein
VAITPDGSTVYVMNFGGSEVSTIDVATQTKDPVDINVDSHPIASPEPPTAPPPTWPTSTAAACPRSTSPPAPDTVVIAPRFTG